MTAKCIRGLFLRRGGPAFALFAALPVPNARAAPRPAEAPAVVIEKLAARTLDARADSSAPGKNKKGRLLEVTLRARVPPDLPAADLLELSASCRVGDATARDTAVTGELTSLTGEVLLKLFASAPLASEPRWCELKVRLRRAGGADVPLGTYCYSDRATRAAPCAEAEDRRPLEH